MSGGIGRYIPVVVAAGLGVFIGTYTFGPEFEKQAADRKDAEALKARASQPVDDETAASIKAAKEASQSAATAAALSKEKPSKVAELTREKATVAPAVKEAREEAERKE